VAETNCSLRERIAVPSWEYELVKMQAYEVDEKFEVI